MKDKRVCNYKEKKSKSLENYENCTCSSKHVCDFEVAANCAMSRSQESFDSGCSIAEAMSLFYPLGIGLWRLCAQ